jgi:hypothetical protein
MSKEKIKEKEQKPMSIKDSFDNLFGNRKKKQLAKEMAQPVTRADLDRLRVELKETPEEREELAIYNKWISMSLKERKEKWIMLSIDQRNRLSKIVNERRITK